MRRASYRRGSLSRAGGVVNSTLNHLGLDHKIKEQQALRQWASVVGPQIAAASRAESIREGILFISCKSSAWSNELSLHKMEIIGRLNKAAGGNVVNDIRFTTRGFRRPPAEIPKEVTTVGAKDLEAVRLTDGEIKQVREIASACPSDELAERIQRAILTGKRMSRLRSKAKDE